MLAKYPILTIPIVCCELTPTAPQNSLDRLHLRSQPATRRPRAIRHPLATDARLQDAVDAFRQQFDALAMVQLHPTRLCEAIRHRQGILLLAMRRHQRGISCHPERSLAHRKSQSSRIEDWQDS